MNLVGCSPWGRKESDATERLHSSFFLCPLDDPCLERHFPSAETTCELGRFLIWLLLESVQSIHNFLSMFLFHWGFQISQPAAFCLTLYFEIIIALQEAGKNIRGDPGHTSPPLQKVWWRKLLFHLTPPRVLQSLLRTKLTGKKMGKGTARLKASS